MTRAEGAALVGDAAWLVLVAHYGGTQMPVPANIEGGAGKRLAGMIGNQPAAALIQYAAGDTLYIAAGWREIRQARHREIFMMRSRGLSYEEISRQFRFFARYTERAIRMILAKVDTP